MTTLTIQDVSRQSGLSEPTLRYYEDVGLLGPIARDERSRHRRYSSSDLDEAQVLACLRAMGVGIDDMRAYQANRRRGHERAGEQRDILLRHAERVEEQIVTLRVHLVAASLTDDEGWDAALSGITDVYHVASPMILTTDPDEIVVPARDGALRVLRAARDNGARRVVLTSSFAAVGYSPKPVRDYDESDWTDPATPGLPAYPLSKAVAERAAWDFIERDGDDLELVVLNPTWIAGPTLTTSARSSLQLFTGLLDGTMTAVPRQRFGIADVRDVSSAHIAAMSTPSAAGKRYLLLADGPTMTYLDVANLLREELGEFGSRVTTDELPGDDPVPLVIHNDRAKAELGFRPRPAVETIVETAESLRDLGLLVH